MANEPITNEPIVNEENNGVDYYIDAMNKMRLNSVSKEEYDKKCEENKKLVEALSNGEVIDNEPPTKQIVEKQKRLQELQNTMFSEDCDLSNLEFAKNTLELHDLNQELNGVDIFLPQGQNYIPNTEDAAASTDFYDLLDHCVEYADGDEATFCNEFQRLIVDSAPMMGGRRR